MKKFRYCSTKATSTVACIIVNTVAVFVPHVEGLARSHVAATEGLARSHVPATTLFEGPPALDIELHVHMRLRLNHC